MKLDKKIICAVYDITQMVIIEEEKRDVVSSIDVIVPMAFPLPLASVNGPNIYTKEEQDDIQELYDDSIAYNTQRSYKYDKIQFLKYLKKNFPHLFPNDEPINPKKDCNRYDAILQQHCTLGTVNKYLAYMKK